MFIKKMCMKSRSFFLLFAVAFSIYSVVVANSHRYESFSELLLHDVESLAQDEGHGQIDSTLEPYMELSSKEIWVPGMSGTTRVPCCRSSSSQYSGCAKGLDRC